MVIKDTRAALLKIINQERQGEHIDQDLVKGRESLGGFPERLESRGFVKLIFVKILMKQVSSRFSLIWVSTTQISTTQNSRPGVCVESCGSISHFFLADVYKTGCNHVGVPGSLPPSYQQLLCSSSLRSIASDRSISKRGVFRNGTFSAEVGCRRIPSQSTCGKRRFWWTFFCRLKLWGLPVGSVEPGTAS